MTTVTFVGVKNRTFGIKKSVRGQDLRGSYVTIVPYGDGYGYLATHNKKSFVESTLTGQVRYRYCKTRFSNRERLEIYLKQYERIHNLKHYFPIRNFNKDSPLVQTLQKLGVSWTEIKRRGRVTKSFHRQGGFNYRSTGSRYRKSFSFEMNTKIIDEENKTSHGPFKIIDNIYDGVVLGNDDRQLIGFLQGKLVRKDTKSRWKFLLRIGPEKQWCDTEFDTFKDVVTYVEAYMKMFDTR